MPKQQPTYDPDRYYRVRVARPVQRGPFKYLPRDLIKMKGAVLVSIIAEHGEDVIRAAQPV